MKTLDQIETAISTQKAHVEAIQQMHKEQRDSCVQNLLSLEISQATNMSCDEPVTQHESS